jgi:hypothetical protein
MNTCWFVVIQSRGAWWIDCEGKSYGPFTSRNDAKEAAVTIAKTFGDRTRRSLVFAPDDEGKQHLVWSEGDTE